ncbi:MULTISPECIES: transporter substrate-binding domain-containing protein [Rhodomicrobium]|uniref:transporter substrate-binding domain-containing protein n=1 Tax=Rhodomicrobium TaxID=1068 RepID=UPI000B4A6A16|nr:MULTISPECIES: transporter substrate-binding domain-containing protein [Rhodomicrobium]
MTAKSDAMVAWLFIGAIIGASCFLATGASAQTCGTDYTLKPGDTLAGLARTVYGNASQWSIIYYANQDRLGTNATLAVPGLSLKIPCLAGTPTAAAPVETSPAGAPPANEAAPFQLSTMLKRIEFLTAEGYPPFTGRDLPQGGMLIDLLQASMDQIKEQANGGFDYQVSWVNDWSAHLNPLLITRAFDAGVPWSKPDCAHPEALDKAGQYICQKFFFSDPLYESVTVLFVRNDGSFNFERDEQIVGKTLCRTKGWSTYDLDKGGRNWVKDGKITLLQPQRAEDCFRLLDEGSVDAVVIAELTGLAVASAMGMGDRIHAAARPINIETMHVIIAKTHASARTVLYYINTSLARLKVTGAYDAITAKHLEQFWGAGSGAASPASTAEAQPQPKPGAGQTPAVKAREPEAGAQQKPTTPGKKGSDGKKTGQP